MDPFSLQRWRQLLSPPVIADDDKQRVATLFHYLLLALIIVNSVAALGGIAFGMEVPSRVAWLILMATYITLFLANHRGYTRGSTIIFSVAQSLVITYLALTTVVDRANLLLALSGILLMAALFVQWRTILGIGVLNVALTVGLYLARPAIFTETAPQSLTTTTLFAFLQQDLFLLLMTSIVLAIGSMSTNNALRAARESKQVLEVRNRELEREIAERQEAQRATQLLRDFMGGISHDIRSPLTTLKASLYILEKTTDSAVRTEKVQKMHQQITRIDRLVQDVLIISRLEQIPALELSPCNVHELVARVGEPLRSVAAQRQLQLQIDLASATGLINGDSNELERAISNLIENALNYTPSGGSVTVRTAIDKGGVCVEVTDTGIGVPKEELGRIFDRFYRTSEARSMRSDGTGLGLAIVDRIVSLHNGKIDINSEVGKGTRFSIWLPAV